MPNEANSAVGKKAKWKKGLTIGEITGELTAVYKSEEKPSKFQEGEMFITQGAKLKTQFGEIRLSLQGQSISRNSRGKTITIEATEDGKGKLSGIEYNTWDSANGGGEELRIGYYARFTDSEGNALTEDSKQDHGQPSATTRQSSGQSYVAYDEIPLSKLITIIAKTHKDIDTIVRDVYKDSEVEEETMRAYVSTVFITADRRGVIDRVLSAGLPAPAPKQEEDQDQTANTQEEDFPQAGGDDDFPEAEAKPTQDEETKFDYGTVTLPKNKNVPEEFQGKKFAELWTKDGGKQYLQNLCLAFNSKGFKRDFEKALRSFCIDFKLVGVASDDKEQVEAVF